MTTTMHGLQVESYTKHQLVEIGKIEGLETYEEILNFLIKQYRGN